MDYLVFNVVGLFPFLSLLLCIVWLLYVDPDFLFIRSFSILTISFCVLSPLVDITIYRCVVRIYIYIYILEYLVYFRTTLVQMVYSVIGRLILLRLRLEPFVLFHLSVFWIFYTLGTLIRVLVLMNPLSSVLRWIHSSIFWRISSLHRRIVCMLFSSVHENCV